MVQKKKKVCVGDIPCPYSRLGGKCRIASKIVPYFPEHKIYVEPFMGSGAVYLNKCLTEKEVINDLDEAIHTFWKVVKKHGRAFDAKNQKVPYNFTTDKSVWQRFKKRVKVKSPLTSLYRALYVIVNSWCGNTGGWGGAKKKTKTYIRKLGLIQDRMKNTTVLQKDYLKVIKKYDSADTFIYLDPPYDVATKAYYGRVVNLKELKDALLDLEGKFILSIDITPNTRKLFNEKDSHIKRIRVLYTAGKRKDKMEYLVSNFPLKKK